MKIDGNKFNELQNKEIQANDVKNDLSKGALSIFSAYANEDNKLDAKEMEQLKNVVNAADRNNDGKLNHSELRDLLGVIRNKGLKDVSMKDLKNFLKTVMGVKVEADTTEQTAEGTSTAETQEQSKAEEGTQTQTTETTATEETQESAKAQTEEQAAQTPKFNEQNYIVPEGKSLKALAKEICISRDTEVNQENIKAIIDEIKNDNPNKVKTAKNGVEYLLAGSTIKIKVGENGEVKGADNAQAEEQKWANKTGVNQAGQIIDQIYDTQNVAGKMYDQLVSDPVGKWGNLINVIKYKMFDEETINSLVEAAVAKGLDNNQINELLDALEVTNIGDRKGYYYDWISRGTNNNSSASETPTTPQIQQTPATSDTTAVSSDTLSATQSTLSDSITTDSVAVQSQQSDSSTVALDTLQIELPQQDSIQ